MQIHCNSSHVLHAVRAPCLGCTPSSASLPAAELGGYRAVLSAAGSTDQVLRAPAALQRGWAMCCSSRAKHALHYVHLLCCTAVCHFPQPSQARRRARWQPGERNTAHLLPRTKTSLVSHCSTAAAQQQANHVQAEHFLLRTMQVARA